MRWGCVLFRGTLTIRRGLPPFLALLGLTLAGCSQTLGGLNASALGYSATGSPTTGAVTGAIGRELTVADQRAIRDAEYRALQLGKTGVPVAWRGSRGHYGEIVPGASYRVNTFDCRDYVHTITVGEHSESGHTTACRQPNGAWGAI
jgi:surface antigen